MGREKDIQKPACLFGEAAGKDIGRGVEMAGGTCFLKGGIAHVHRLCSDLAVIGPWAGLGTAGMHLAKSPKG